MIWTALTILIILYLLGAFSGFAGQYIHLMLILIVGLIAYYVLRERRKG